MSAIKHALARLDSAIGNLEGSVKGIEKTLAGQQRDMFTASPKPAGKSQNGHGVDSAVMAQKLDQAIERVEAILRDV